MPIWKIEDSRRPIMQRPTETLTHNGQNVPQMTWLLVPWMTCHGQWGSLIDSLNAHKTMSMHQLGKAAEADKYLLKQVLQVIEGKHLARDTVDSLDHHVFKSPENKDLVPECQHYHLCRAWDNLWCLTVQNYNLKLLELGVKPGASTQLELKRAEQEASGKKASARRIQEDSSEDDGSEDSSISEDSSNKSNITNDNACVDDNFTEAFNQLDLGPHCIPWCQPTPTLPPHSNFPTLATPPTWHSTPPWQQVMMTPTCCGPSSIWKSSFSSPPTSPISSPPPWSTPVQSLLPECHCLTCHSPLWTGSLLKAHRAILSTSWWTGAVPRKTLPGLAFARLRTTRLMDTSTLCGSCASTSQQKTTKSTMPSSSPWTRLLSKSHQCLPGNQKKPSGMKLVMVWRTEGSPFPCWSCCKDSALDIGGGHQQGACSSTQLVGGNNPQGEQRGQWPCVGQ